MASYTPLPVSAVDDPLTAELVNALRENPLAIAEGAGGAPRIEDAALSGSVTGAGINWVSARVVNNAWNGVGQTVMAVQLGGTAEVSWGSVVSGGGLYPSSTQGSTPSTTTLPGSWRCQGYIPNIADSNQRTTLWLRVN